MTEKRPGPAPGVRLIEVSVKRELTVLLITLFYGRWRQAADSAQYFALKFESISHFDLIQLFDSFIERNI